MITADVHRNLKLRIGVGFVRKFLDIMLAPLMVIHFSHLYGAATAGLMTLAIAVAVVGCAFVGGHMSDTLGRRPTLLLGEIGSAAALVLLALANSPWWHSGTVTFCCYLLSTSLFGIAVPANDAMMVDISTPETRAQIYTINYWSINVAFLLGSLTGGFAFGGYFFYLLAGAAVLASLIALVTLVAISETAPRGRAGEVQGRGWLKTLLGGYMTALRDSVLARLVLSALLIRSVEIQISYYIAVRLSKEFGRQQLLDTGPWRPTVNGVEMLGILRAANTLIVVCLALFAAWLFGRLSDRQRIFGGIALFTAGYMVWGASNAPWLLLVAAVVLTVGEIMSVPIRQVLLADLVPAEDRSRYMAVYQINVQLGMIVASLCLAVGVLVPAVGMSVLFGLFGVGAMALYWSLFRERDARAAAAPQAVVARESA
ncbi:DHA1 family multidrug resistance protein B-like MFS transporter [Streptomyces puniciscabiei]|uniref:DHA1 family multidrug resistance protein B-like MFS transporter n=1 Tax=Streptomyces puniciscabiei TaxID=164348 RepID=A0A542SXA3_9ACTN|nr:MFS transporter [Streptomyces puniciscabiei]TQK79240.1 DHA1 family multidrug resistance protein B-like MFS transporter [Streptomyces puniciscabiei]